MNTSSLRGKIGKLDLEINWLSKVLFVMMCLISLIIVAIDGFIGSWHLKFFRICLLLCSIIPISMRINLDLAKIYYSYQIQNDSNISGCIVRNSTIPEELGRIQFLLTDKTGTLT
jgi:phospholipid-translocating ATPase